MLGEFIGQIIGELVVMGAAYYTGKAALHLVTLGRIKIAPLTTYDETNKGKTRWTDNSIWLHRPLHGKMLKCEVVCLVGLLVWVLVGAAIYFAVRNPENESGPARGSKNEQYMKPQ